jgi:hypothetical protein
MVGDLPGYGTIWYDRRFLGGYTSRQFGRNFLNELQWKCVLLRRIRQWLILLGHGESRGPRMCLGDRSS